MKLRASAQDKKKKKPFNKLTPEEHALRKAWSEMGSRGRVRRSRKRKGTRLSRTRRY